MLALLPDDEATRLAVLKDHRILDTPPQEEFDDLVRLAAQVCGVPIAAVSLIDSQRQWFKSILGLPLTETPRDIAFCAHTILQPDVFVVQDATVDPRFADNPLVTGDPHIRFYAGAPLIAEDGDALGALCVLDKAPRNLTPEQQDTLRLLARQVSSHLKAARRLAERERLVAEREHAEAERLCLATIVQSSADAIMSADLSGNIVSWNAGAARLFGYSAEEIIGQPQAALVPPDETSIHANHIQTVIEDGRLENLEVVRLHKNGERISVSLALSLICDAAGQAIGISAVARDITVRKRAEAALEREYEFNQALMESLQEGIVACDASGILTHFNRATREFHGLPESPLPPEEWAEHFDLFHADGLTPMQVSDIPLFRALQGETVRNAEMVIAPKDSPRRTILASGQAIFGAGGKKLGAVAAMHDVTESKRAEEALRRSEARLAEAQRVAQIGSWEYNVAAAKITWSDELFRLFGMDPAEGAPSVEVLMNRYHPDDVPMHIAVSNQAMQDGEPYEFDIRVPQPDGTLRWFHAVGCGERDSAGKVTRLFGTMMDITERRRAEERFRVLFEQSSDAHLLCAKGGIIDCNNATVSLLGYPDKAALMGIHPALLSPEFQPDGRRSGESGYEMDTLAREQGFHRFEWTHRRMDGEEFPTEVWLTPVTLADGPAMLSVLHDLSERKRHEEQIRDHMVVLDYQKQELENVNAELAELATTDGLTGLKNHRTFQDQLAKEVIRATRYNTPLSVVMLDVDYFKQYNDRFGHPAGDEVLRKVSAILLSCVRDTDLVARYGGEEFAVVLPQTPGEGAAVIAERIRETIATAHWPSRAITVSLGVATLFPGIDDGGALISRADAALYQSKSAGRNRVMREIGSGVPAA